MKRLLCKMAYNLWQTFFLTHNAQMPHHSYLDAHVMDGYRFLMQNYRVGDKICIFGLFRLYISAGTS